MTRFVKGPPPGPKAGDTNPMTTILRPSSGLTAQQEARARKLARQGWPSFEIAVELGVPEDGVVLAIRNLRTKRPNPPRETFNVSRAAGRYMRSLLKPGEAVHEALDRIFAEHSALRDQGDGGTAVPKSN